MRTFLVGSLLLTYHILFTNKIIAESGNLLFFTAILAMGVILSLVQDIREITRK